VANLIIDIGNTALKASWCDGMTLGKTFRYQGERMLDFILSLTSKTRPETMVLSSVRNFSESNIKRLENECERLVVVGRDVYSRYDIPEFITPDRAAAIVASRYLFKGKGCTIFDFGTTLSMDFLDAEGKYEGGNISPGCRTRFRALNRYTKSLPLVDAPESENEKGTDIRTSIESGVISGIIFEIEGYILRHPQKISVFTGGDAIYFAKRMKNSIFVVSNLVLMGLALIAVEYDKKD
jgi:type III pantothenate kinase